MHIYRTILYNDRSWGQREFQGKKLSETNLIIYAHNITPNGPKVYTLSKTCNM